MKKSLHPRYAFHHLLDNLTMLQKLMLLFLISVVLPLLMQNVFYYSDAESKINEQMEQRLTSSLNERASNINGSLSSILALSTRFYTNEALYKLIDTNYKNKLEYLITYQEQLLNALQNVSTYPQVSAISVYTNNITLFNSPYVRKLKRSDWNLETLGETIEDVSYIPIDASNNSPCLRVAVTTNTRVTTSNRSVSILRPMRNYAQYAFYNKALRIDINLPYLSSMLRNSDMFDNMMLVDSENRILASVNTYPELGAFQIFDEKDLKEGDILMKQPLKDFPSLSIYSIYNSNIISDAFAEMRIRTIAVALMSMAMAFLFMWLIAGNITRRLRLVVDQAGQIAKGNFIQIDAVWMGGDEIGKLARSTNEMSTQLQELIEQEYDARLRQTRLEREKAQANLLALQSQVDPHFMFNALECIRLKAMDKNEVETARMIKYMSRMFRHLIDWDEDLIYLRDDIKFLTEFLAIQKYRFDDEFDYTLNVSEAAENCLLPKLIIQPLVENACVHGVEAIATQRHVDITATVHDKMLHLIVSDNGGGMDQARLDALHAMLSGGEPLKGSVGLYNVYQRLKLYYGGTYTLSVSSRVGSGTCFSVEIPLRNSKEEFHVHDPIG